MLTLAIILVIGLSLIVFLNSFQKSALAAQQAAEKKRIEKKKVKKKSR